MEKRDITPEVVRCLVSTQFPGWGDLPVVPVDVDGWDNTTYRLGEHLSVRLPSAAGYVPQVAKEHRWLPVLAPHLPVPVPRPVARGGPGCGFPRPWSVYEWLPGRAATAATVAEPVSLARDLASFLRVLRAVDAGDGPPAGAHSFFRGASPATYDADTRAAIAALADEVDAPASDRVWERALESSWEGAPVWVHGDITPSNLLVDEGGALGAVIDFGCCCVGDPACDVAIAWTFFEGESREAFRAGLGLDESTWERGRGWALWKALITRVGERRAAPGSAPDAARFGWRQGALATIEAVLAG